MYVHFIAYRISLSINSKALKYHGPNKAPPSPVMTDVNTEQRLSLGNGYSYSHDFGLFCQLVRDTGDHGMYAFIQLAQRVYLYKLTSQKNDI